MRVYIRVPGLVALIGLMFALSAYGSSSAVSSDPQPGGGDAYDESVSSAAAPAVNTQKLAAGSTPAEYIPSTEALNHMGEDVTVRGLVADYQYHGNKKGKLTLLLFDVSGVAGRESALKDSALKVKGMVGMETPNTFTAVVLRDDSSNFPPNFGPLWNGKVLCVTGTIEDYQGSPAIIVSEGTDIVAEC